MIYLKYKTDPPFSFSNFFNRFFDNSVIPFIGGLTMVEIAPFKGVSYNKEKISTLDDVMSPPYDIISPEMQQSLYDKHPQNYVRLILGRQFEDDTQNNNRYTRAKQQLDTMMKQKILQPSEKPSIYPYKITYNVDGRDHVMHGFFVLLKLDPSYKLVKAHERTLSKPKADRLNLMRACHANLEPIQLLYIDEKDAIRTAIEHQLDEPLISVKGYDGFTHSLWKLDDEQVISQITEQLKDKILFIADGHHRYQTAINYAEEMKKKTGNTDENAPFNYRMVILVNIFDKGLAILPTHRFIKKNDVDLDNLMKQLNEFFTVMKKPITRGSRNYERLSHQIKQDIATTRKHSFALYTKNMYYLLTLKDEHSMDRFAKDRSSTWRTLDVSILHKIVLEHLMGITQENLEDHVAYTRVDEEALKHVDDGTYDFSILMNATKIEELKAVADAGEHMPQKSTYFLPKMLSGLVMYSMDIK
jgi:uncharacterized protein (DUF1015 family)